MRKTMVACLQMLILIPTFAIGMSAAVNGEWAMLVWPDIRGGPHVRFSLMRDPGAATP
jgi:hypothetical protein